MRPGSQTRQARIAGLSIGAPGIASTERPQPRISGHCLVNGPMSAPSSAQRRGACNQAFTACSGPRWARWRGASARVGRGCGRSQQAPEEGPFMTFRWPIVPPPCAALSLASPRRRAVAQDRARTIRWSRRSTATTITARRCSMRRAAALPPQYAADARSSRFFPMLVERLIDLQLLVAKAAEAGGLADDDEVKRRVAERSARSCARSTSSERSRRDGRRRRAAGALRRPSSRREPAQGRGPRPPHPGRGPKKRPAR